MPTSVELSTNIERSDMFTGIIEEIGQISLIRSAGNNLQIGIKAAKITETLSADDSVSVNGCCLTVVFLDKSGFTVQAVKETLGRTSVGKWHSGEKVNLERAVKMGDRLDGHIVQGHVDGRAVLINRSDFGDHADLTFRTDRALTEKMVEKGSVAVNGVSLTISGISGDSFRVSLIPYTWKNTVLKYCRSGQTVNIETDILGKYIEKNTGVFQEENMYKKLRNWGYNI